MTSYRIYSLYSGSTGNAMLLETEQTRILIDAGKNAKALCRALGELSLTPEQLDAIIITHDHRDHTSALPVFLKHHPLPVHAVEASAQVMAMDMGDEARACLCRHSPLYVEQIGNVQVSSFITPHDSRFSVGYRLRVEASDGVHEIGYATDIGYVTEDVRQGLTGCESVVLESNHDREMLLTGPYPRQLKERIFSRYG
ncbi:MAG: MBL fold metallo-hydrolase, partial [Clostridia bacterium]|nr:MBL fold metallo-hydrolase [Clostridia bacterium]